jgi:prepilin-type N-terminal cleavage/methylation domain-containing protein
MTAARRRPGYTLLELLTVIGILVVIGGIAAPTITAIGGDTKVKAGADAVRARMAEARAAAIEEGRAYRVAVSQDGTHIRVAPDDQDFANQATTTDDDNKGPLVAEDSLPQNVTAVPIPDEGAQPVVDQSGWVRVVTFLPDGTCREASAVLEVREPGSHSLVLRVRGLTGATSVTTAQPGGASP